MMYSAGWIAATPQPMGIEWVQMSDGEHPAYAIQAGIDSGSQLFVARAFHEGGMIPGKLHDGHSSAYVAYGGEEIPKAVYEVYTFFFVKKR
jgi:hypothetical protein